ncbi:5-(carboxyamino)imidazole ribonucleotide mutase [Leptospirillum ferriphilum]|jgi:5-(carboxyamino)imidazole ribonucleotide mutase|uniref:N5-carboxyaminoimidazole ribonucleotide mutase n=2 Tax=Leptospirillum TaxID=179 RepID=A0A094YHR1_9BACT|nr:5-(carboxyamino)imidazole ribonucleotide mutase [Leptospirillum ferriphilum]EDZ39342.1 MAG: Phosphoribosylaminoimidazole carboxylase, catalytic subunit [Leptospirillum sp. Group II '5-way CG']KGA92736.1 Phosphoribosylaminoimidazole carboxylase catalytic subunit [Leptospirillum ferriphilum]
MITPSPPGTGTTPLVGVVMGSTTDWKVMKVVSERLHSFGIPHESRVVSAHRTPDLLFEYAREARGRGLKILIAGAGGAAHLPGMLASSTTLPVLGVPIPSTLLNGMDSLLSIVQMPKGIPVGTLAIGEPGAENAALLALQILAVSDPGLTKKLEDFRQSLRKKVLESDLTKDAPS